MPNFLWVTVERRKTARKRQTANRRGGSNRPLPGDRGIQ
ncbi:hypothetical protein G5B34_11735 [Enterobacter hormaechei]|nr:hypothetical protein [Enterobacter hormaechei]HAS0715805.1 hypothetical protein [Enterobacter hormaechei subsp. steigerwaltii]EHF4960346.1 hypothetical protein [Enterobacter hormaechei]EHF4975858.1 hypothetical protein [Enterobacter hormaechei]EHF4981090.1 hypothetical protein [Enterobacter hormaechei]